MDRDQLESELECTVCFHIPRCKIYVCVNMHKICDSCYNKLKAGKQCPHGSCDYDKPPRRNRDLENIIGKSDFGLNCRHEVCNVELTREELVKHEKNLRELCHTQLV